MKKLFTILAALALVILCATLLPTEAQAATITQSGTCGDNLTWALDDAGTLTISGTGAMDDYTYSSTPWYSSRSSVKTVVIEDGVTSIGNYAFEYCTSLTSVTIPNSVTSIGNSAFYKCTSLTSVTIPNSVTTIGNDAFEYCTSLTSVTIPDSVVSICNYAFSYCDNLTSISIGKGVTSIEGAAFYKSPIQNVYITDIAAWCNIYFESCWIPLAPPPTLLETVVYGNPLCDGADLYLNGVLVTDLVIPDGVTEISNYAFYNYVNLASVVIPNSVTEVGFWAFDGCTSLKSVAYCGTEKQWNQITINSDNAPLMDAKRTYHTSHNWVGGDCVTPQTCSICHIEGDYTHVWIDATCTTLKYCFLCGKTEGSSQHSWVAATCTTPKTCSLCGTTEGAALGHTWKNATCLMPKQCKVCGVTTGTTGDHTYDNNSDAFCNVCNHQRVLNAADLTYYGIPGLSFQEYIGMQVLTLNTTLASYDKVYVIAVQQTPNGETTTISNGIPYAGYYTIFEQQIVSWSMTEQVTMTLYGEKNGITYKGASITTSVKKLAEEKLKTYSTQGNTAVCRALVDMLNYGAAVQEYYEYNDKNLPNADIEKYLSYGSTNIPNLAATNSITGTGKVPVYGDNISLQDKVEFNLMFYNADLVGKEVKASVGGAAVEVLYNTEIAPGWTIARVAVATAKMRETYTIALYDANGKIVSKVYNVSVEGYAKAREGTEKAVVDVALMRYGDSVRALLP